MLMSLGMFVFELPTLPFNELQQRTSYRHGRSPRFGARDANQFLGPGDETISLAGTIPMEVAGNLDSIVELKDMASTGEAWPLVDGVGVVHGDFVIEDIDERKSHFIAGGVPKLLDFTISLRRVD